MSLARATCSFSCHQLASSAPQLSSAFPTAPRRVVATRHSKEDIRISYNTNNGTVDLYNTGGAAPLYDDFHPDDYARPKRNSSAVNAAVYEVRASADFDVHTCAQAP